MRFFSFVAMADYLLLKQLYTLKKNEISYQQLNLLEDTEEQPRGLGLEGQDPGEKKEHREMNPILGTTFPLKEFANKYG